MITVGVLCALCSVPWFGVDTVYHSAMVVVVIVGGWKYLKCLLSFGQRLKAYELQMGQVFVVPFDIIANNLRELSDSHTLEEK